MSIYLPNMCIFFNHMVVRHIPASILCCRDESGMIMYTDFFNGLDSCSDSRTSNETYEEKEDKEVQFYWQIKRPASHDKFWSMINKRHQAASFKRPGHHRSSIIARRIGPQQLKLRWSKPYHFKHWIWNLAANVAHAHVRSHWHRFRSLFGMCNHWIIDHHQ